jgi:type I restriction enzyme S subunit
MIAVEQYTGKMSNDGAESVGAPAGYRVSEMGVIPNDWEVKPFGQMAEITMGQSPPGISYNRKGVGLPLINGPTEFTKKHPVKIQWTTQPTSLCKDGDILLCVRGSSTGKMNISNDLYCIGRGIASIRAKLEVDPSFISFQLNFVIQKILILTTGSTFPNIDGKTIRNIEFPLPPIKEQKTIAEVLSDVDSLITNLDQLIAKERNIKQAVMQQLLTGKQRLPGFSRDWRRNHIGGIFQFLSTANNPRSDLSEHGYIGYIHYGDIHGGTSPFLDCSKKTMPYIDLQKVKNLPLLEEGDLIIADASEDYEGIGKSVEITNINNKKIVAGLHTMLLRGNRSIIVDGFKGYLQYIPSLRSAMVRLATGISVYGISKNNLKNVEINLPSIDEQTAIAKVLSDMDAEIFTLEQQRDKIRALKQGMMQELLTGRIRLI